MQTANHSARRWLRLLAALALAPAMAQAQISLRTVVDLAQKNSTKVRIAEADVRKAQAVLSETKDVLVPAVDFQSGLPTFPEVGFTGTPPSIWSATVQSLIFGIPQKRYIDSARMGVQAASKSLADAREQVALDASTAYIELDTLHTELAAAKQEQEDAQRLVEIEQERTEAGMDPLSEVLQAKLTSAQTRLKLIHMESRSAALASQLAALTGLPADAITTDPASIPEIPKFDGKVREQPLAGIESANMLAQSKQLAARGDQEVNYLPQLSFFAQYNRNTTLLNSVNDYFKKNLPTNNFSSGISIDVPIFNFVRRAKARESAAEALRARVEAEQARHENDVQIADLTGKLRELDAMAEVASLKQQIAADQLKTVETQLNSGNGAGVGPSAQPPPSPKMMQLARIDEREKYEDELNTGLDLAKARLGLLQALGHMQDWLDELHTK